MIVNCSLRIACGVGGRNGPGGHCIRCSEGGLIIHHCTVVLLPAVEILADIAVGVGIGCMPPAGMADGQGPAGIEDALVSVHDMIAHHQVPVGAVEVDELLFRCPVDCVRRPARDRPFQRVQVVAAMVAVGRGVNRNGKGRQQNQGFSPICKNTEIKISVKYVAAQIAPFQPFGVESPPFCVVFFMIISTLFVKRLH